MNSGIYVLKNKINNKIYVGQSTNISNRIKRHFAAANEQPSSRDQIITKAIRKYEKENFIVETFSYDISELDKMEQKYINQLNSLIPNGYNLQSGGHFTKTHHDLTKRKMSEMRQGKNHPMFGKRHSEETKKKISEGNKGKIMSLESRQKMYKSKMGNKSNTGRTLTIEHRKNISKSLSGSNHPMFGKTRCCSKMRGTNNPQSKLTEKDVLSIKIMLTEGMAQQAIATMFKVSQKTISNISLKKTWRHICP